jgi:hypothetical protein
MKKVSREAAQNANFYTKTFVSLREYFSYLLIFPGKNFGKINNAAISITNDKGAVIATAVPKPIFPTKPAII